MGGQRAPPSGTAHSARHSNASARAPSAVLRDGEASSVLAGWCTRRRGSSCVTSSRAPCAMRSSTPVSPTCPPHPASSSRADPRWNGSTLQPQDRAYDRRDLRAQAAGPYAVLLLRRKRHHVAAELPATSTAQQPRPELHHAIPLLSA
ncbi:hypothetical protein Golomagni_08379 [Golovinomyces magnicellulatus]|nr:hypothetical protein Golomagni_08379 [Golovinomyces magnicellulatus]